MKVVLAAALWAMCASATTMIELDVPGLTRTAATVVRGRVVRVEARWTQDHSRIITDTELEVTETWKGASITGQHVIVMQPGGAVGDVGQRVHGAAQFSLGEDVVLFLEPRGPRYSVVALTQGKFRLETSSDGKATFARRTLAEVTLLDPSSHAPAEPQTSVLTVEQLRAAVAQAVELAPTEAPPSVTPRVTP